MAVIKRKGKRGKITYYVCLKIKGRKSPIWERAGGDLRYAKSLNRQRLEEVRSGTYEPKTKNDLLVKEYVEAWVTKRPARSRKDEEGPLDNYLLCEARAWLHGKRMAMVRGPDALRLVDELEATISQQTGKPLSPKYVANIVGIISNVFATAERHEVILRNPFRVLERRRLTRKSKRRRAAYPMASLHALLQDPRVSPSARVFLAIAFLTGMREGEVCGLRWRDWDLAPSPLTCLTVEKQYEGRLLKSDEIDAGEHTRWVPVHPLLEHVLRWWHDAGFEAVHARKPLPDDPIVPRRGGGSGKVKRRVLGEELGQHHTRSSAYKMWRAACDAAEVQNLSLHSTRHTFITLARRYSEKERVEALTHNSAGDVIDVYNHRQWDELCETVSRVELHVTPGLTSGLTSLLLGTANIVEALGIEPRGREGTKRNYSGRTESQAPPESPEEPPGSRSGDAECDARQPHDLTGAEDRLRRAGDRPAALLRRGVERALTGDEPGTLEVLHEVAALATGGTP